MLVVIVRSVLAVLALVCCAWFALGVRQSHDLAAANAIVSAQGKPTPAQARRVNSLLDSASTLNPDQQVNILRAGLNVDLGRYQQRDADHPSGRPP